MTIKEISLPSAFPINATTGKEYNGSNVEKLLNTDLYDQRWATFRQWKSAGYKVKKGSKGTELIKVVSVKDKKSPKLEKRVPRRFWVFNICQVEEIK